MGNDIEFGGTLRLLIISGSHMSGKSTFLKSMGIAVALAWAGAPVPARSLRVSPLLPAASTRVEDSLHDRKSRFFTEAERIGRILDMARRETPVFYLLDEILSGTNSHDRRLGAEAILRALVEAGALGVITTHDLAITEIAHSLGDGAANMHFEDSVSDGRLAFDYRLRPGVVESSNALELLRICGVRV